MKRCTDGADNLAIRGFSGNRILLNIDGRPVNASGVVGGYYKGECSVLKTACAENRQADKPNGFWERMALHYPLPFDTQMLADTRRVLRLVKSKGVAIAHATVLDIGCGTGIYTLPLAHKAAMVTGLDDSQAMLARMTQVASSNGIENVRPLKASWKTIDPAACDFEKAFDIAWVSMSPAVQTHQDFMKMEQCARKWCVYIGWGRKRKNPLMQEIFNLHGLAFQPPAGVAAAHEILARCGRTPSVEYFETAWDWTGTIEDAAAEMAGFIEMHGGRARLNLIEKVLASEAHHGQVCHTTEVEEGLMVWPVQ